MNSIREACQFPRPFALANNRGNLCWLNSTIQAFMGLFALRRLLAHNNSIARYIQNLYYAESSDIQGQVDLLILALNGAITTMNMDEQNCTDEFFTALIPILPESWRMRFYMRNTVKISCGECGTVTIDNSLPSYHMRIPTNVSFSNENDLVEYLLERKEPCNTKCPQKHEGCIQIQGLDNLNHIIVLTFARSERNQKIYSPPYLKFPTANVTYQLVSIIKHYGGMYGAGHYICESIREIGGKKQWVGFSDNICHIIAEMNWRDSATYMVFYQRLP